MERDKDIWVAWAGWRLQAPPDWRPLHIAHEGPRGRIMLGTAGAALLQVKWWRPAKKRFDAGAWLARRIRQAAPGAVPVLDDPKPAGFSHAARAEARDDGSDIGKSVWYGYAPGPDLVIEVMAAGETGTAKQRDTLRRVVLTLRVSEPGQAVPWAVFDASFETPPGFALRRRRLNLGDVALELAAPRGRRLVVRQVYPGSLAVARRPLARWIEDVPFAEHRAYRPRPEPAAWNVPAGARALPGLKREGWKRLPFPLGRVAARFGVAAAVEDKGLDRLLLAEYTAPQTGGCETLAGLVAGMNWARRNGWR